MASRACGCPLLGGTTAARTSRLTTIGSLGMSQMGSLFGLQMEDNVTMRKKMNIMKLAHTRIVTKNVPALARFYEEITGITPFGVEDYKEFETPSGGFAISSQSKIDLHGAGAATSGANRSLILDFEVVDVDLERARLATIVEEFVLEPTDQPWGNRSMMFRDPDGNLINFFTRASRTSPQPTNGL